MQRAAVVQLQLETLRCRFNRGNTRVQEPRKRRLLTARQRTQRVLDVVTVDPALREIPVAYCETTTAAPAHEMIWVLGEEAHAVGARVEQVLGTVRAVRDAAAETFVRFDQGDVEMFALVGEQMCSQRGTAETCSHDRDMLLIAHAARVTDTR